MLSGLRPLQELRNRNLHGVRIHLKDDQLLRLAWVCPEVDFQAQISACSWNHVLAHVFLSQRARTAEEFPPKDTIE